MPALICLIVSLMVFTPASASLSCNESAVSVGVISTSSFTNISPVSNPAFICIVVTPVISSPFIMLH